MCVVLVLGPTEVDRHTGCVRFEGTQDSFVAILSRALLRVFARPTEAGAATKPMGFVGAAAAEAAAVTASAPERCQSLLRRCFEAVLSERDDGVRGLSARLWTELLQGLGR